MANIATQQAGVGNFLSGEVNVKPESVAICDTLLAHHRHVCPTGNERFEDCTIGYLRLCTDAGVPFLYRTCGPFLLEVAEWCEANGWPPLNALSINEQKREPGGEYDLAPGCNIATWAAEVARVVEWRDYPESVEVIERT